MLYGLYYEVQLIAYYLFYQSKLEIAVMNGY